MNLEYEHELADDDFPRVVHPPARFLYRDAACTDLAVEVRHLFFPDNYDDPMVLSITRQVCGACPVSHDCLRFAVDNDIEDGIWAGTTPDDRVRLRLRGRLFN